MQSCDERRRQHLELIEMSLCQVGQDALAAFRDAQTNCATIFNVAVASDQAGIDQPIDQLDHRMVTNDELRRQLTDRRLGPRRQPPNRQQQLMLARLDPVLPRGRLGERAEPA